MSLKDNIKWAVCLLSVIIGVTAAPVSAKEIQPGLDFATAVNGEIPGISLTDFTSTNGNVRTHFLGVDISASVKQRRAYFDYEVTYKPTDEVAPGVKTMQVYLGVDDERIGSVENMTLNGQPLVLDEQGFVVIPLDSGTQTINLEMTLPDQKRYARLLSILYVMDKWGTTQGHQLDMGLLFSNYASEFSEGKKKLDITQTVAEREALRRPKDLIPSESEAAKRLKIVRRSFSNPDDIKIYLNDSAISDTNLFIEKRYNATSKKSLANLWGADELYNPEKGLYYLDEFEEVSVGENFGLMISVINFDEEKARNGEITVYLPHVGTYETMSGETKMMGAYLTMSDFYPGAAGLTGGPGDNLAPFVYLSNNLYSGIVYNKLGNINVKYEFVTADGQKVLDVQRDADTQTVLTAPSLNDHKHTNPFGSSGDSWRAFAEGVGWVTGDRNAVNQALVTDETNVMRFGQRYIGANDTGWVDALNGTNFERSAVSFGLDGKSATLSFGSQTNGVRQQILTSKLSVPTNHRYSFAVKQTVDQVADMPADGDSDDDLVTTNGLDGEELVGDHAWSWTYIDTYDTSQDYLISPRNAVFKMKLPNNSNDAVQLDTANIWNVGDAVQVYNTRSAGERQVLVPWTDYTVSVTEEGSQQVVTITLNAYALHRLDFNGGYWAVGMRLVHDESQISGSHQYNFQSEVAYQYTDSVYDRNARSTVATYYRGGVPADVSEQADLTVLTLDEAGSPLFGGTYELTDAIGEVVSPDENLNGSELRWENLPDGMYQLKQLSATNTYWRLEDAVKLTIKDDVLTVIDGDVQLSQDGQNTKLAVVNKSADVRLKMTLADKSIAGATYMITSATGKEYRCPLKEDGRLMPKLKRGHYKMVMSTAPDGVEKDTTVYSFEVDNDGVVSADHTVPENTAALPVGSVQQNSDGDWEVVVKAKGKEEASIFPVTGGGHVFFLAGTVALLSAGSLTLIRKMSRQTLKRL
jgi:hypothetical protein